MFLEKLSARATALSMALLLFTVSWNSASGSESFTQPPRASSCHRARVNHFLSRDRSDLIGFHGHDIGGMAIKREEFYFVGFAILIDVDDRAHIAGDESMRRERRRQNDSIVLFDHTHLLVTPDKR